MGLERPILLLIFSLAAGLIFIFLKKRVHVGFPSLKHLPTSTLAKTTDILAAVLPIMAVLSLIGSISGFHLSSKEVTRYGYGSDIVVVLDESGSMNDPFAAEKNAVSSTDQKPLGKIDAAKKIIRPFIKGRKDRLGLVAFGGVTILLYPLSFNQDGFLLSFDAQTAMLGSTVIDTGLAQALMMLEKSPAKTKVIILISDGGGRIEDEKYQLSSRINANGVHFYWVGVDSYSENVYSDGTFANPMDTFMKKLNPALAKSVDVTDTKKLDAAFNKEIEGMERSLIAYKEKTEQGNLFLVFAWIGLLSATLCLWLEAIHND